MQSSSRHRFEHGADAGLKSDLTQPGVAYTGIEDTGARSIMVVPDHGRQSKVITQSIGELTTGELEIIHKVVDALEPPAEGEINTANDVVKMNPGIDVIAVFTNRLARSTSDVGRDVLPRAIDATQPENTGLG